MDSCNYKVNLQTGHNCTFLAAACQTPSPVGFKLPGIIDGSSVVLIQDMKVLKTRDAG